MSSSLSLALRVEKNVICLLLGRRTIKKLVRHAAGKHGAALVDQIYKLAGFTLGKRKAKKFISKTVNVIAEVSVLTIHGKLNDHELQNIRRAVYSLVTKFKEIQSEIVELRTSASPREPYEEEMIDWKKRFCRCVRRTEMELTRLLQPHCQQSTLWRLLGISKTLRDPLILSVCFQDGQPKVTSLIKNIIETSEKIPQDQMEMIRTRSRSLSQRRQSKSRSLRRRVRTRS